MVSLAGNNLYIQEMFHGPTEVHLRICHCV